MCSQIYNNIIQVFTLFMKAIFSQVRHPSHPGWGHASPTCHMTQFEQSDCLRSENFINIMIEYIIYTVSFNYKSIDHFWNLNSLQPGKEHKENVLVIPILVHGLFTILKQQLNKFNCTCMQSYVYPLICYYTLLFIYLFVTAHCFLINLDYIPVLSPMIHW